MCSEPGPWSRPRRGVGWREGGGVVKAGRLIAWVVCLRVFPLVVVCSARCARCTQGCWCAAPSLACGQRRLRRSGGVRWGGACERSVGPGSGARPGGCLRGPGAGSRTVVPWAPALGAKDVHGPGWRKPPPPQGWCSEGGGLRGQAARGLGFEGRGCRLVDGKRTRTEGARAGGPRSVARAARLQGRAADPPPACGSGGRVVGCKGASGRRCWEWSPAWGQGGSGKKKRRQKPTAPGIPRRSPIQVLTRPDPA